MNNYPLKPNKYNWRLLEPQTNVSYTDEYLEDHYDLYLTSEFIHDDDGRPHRYYRLHAAKPHSIEMALAYDIRCPLCTRTMLKQVGRCKDYYTLGLYECPACDRQ